MEVQSPVARTRKAHFVLRLNDYERGALDRVGQRLGMNASETMRHLIRRADEDGDTTAPRRRPVPTKARKNSADRTGNR
jgi:hypothetical protein